MSIIYFIIKLKTSNTYYPVYNLNLWLLCQFLKYCCVFTAGDIETVINLAPALKFNGGGHINHTIFWQNLSPNGGKPSDELTKAIEKYSKLLLHDFMNVTNFCLF